ncbi:MAG: hypothetical protein JXA18_02090 [Chitinispirillaceae bacterium]|nr:hypothetical protein [Chitinispirillaceae bacterium]
MKKGVSLCLVFGMLWAGSFVVRGSAYAGTYTITVDAGKQVAALPHFWSECVGTGTMLYCLKPEWQVAAKIGADEAGFRRVRGHGILMGWNGTDDPGIIRWSGTGTPAYNWVKFDSIINVLIRCNLRPIVELSFMPKDLQSNTVISKPKDWNVWRDLIREIVAHCVAKFGPEEVESWYWEVWNEYDYQGFWNGNDQDYYMLYQKAVEGAKSANGNVIVGGPATTGASPLQAFLDYCTANSVKVDLLSNHCYGSSPGDASDPVNVRNDNRSRAGVIKKSGKKLFSLNTEYSSTWQGQGGYTQPNVVSMDSHINAPFVVKCIKLIIDDYAGGQYALPDVLSYWAISDVFDESGSNKGSFIEMNNKIPFGGVFGLITYHGIRKATFNAFKMLHLTGTALLSLTGGSKEADGVDGFATINADTSEAAVILYNYYKDFSGGGGDNIVELTVKNLPFSHGKLKVVRYLVDADHSNPYGVWVKQGKPVRPTNDEWEAMRAAQELARREPDSQFDFTGNAFTESFTLGRHALSLLLIGREGPVAADGKPARRSGAEVVSLHGTMLILHDFPRKRATIRIVNAEGRILSSFVAQAPSFDAGRDCAPGLYLVDVECGGFRNIRKMTVQ